LKTLISFINFFVRQRWCTRKRNKMKMEHLSYFLKISIYITSALPLSRCELTSPIFLGVMTPPHVLSSTIGAMVRVSVKVNKLTSKSICSVIRVTVVRQYIFYMKRANYYVYKIFPPPLFIGSAFERWSPLFHCSSSSKLLVNPLTLHWLLAFKKMLFCLVF